MRGALVGQFIENMTWDHQLYRKRVKTAKDFSTVRLDGNRLYFHIWYPFKSKKTSKLRDIRLQKKSSRARFFLLVACWAPGHYLDQYWFIIKWSPRNVLKWNTNRNTKRSIHENAFANVVRELTTILSKGWWVKQRTNNCKMGSPNHFLLWPHFTN